MTVDTSESGLQKPGHTNRLVVVGTGIRFYGQLTLEAKVEIEKAEKLLYLVNEPLTEAWLQQANNSAESLFPFYRQPGERREENYRRIADYILMQLRSGLNVCAVFYGHPGVFAMPPHMTIRDARQEGYEAVMLPGISAEDCLFADIGIDPGVRGCQSFEATDFLLRRRIWDPTAHLILWQVASVGNLQMGPDRHVSSRQQVLIDELVRVYPPGHGVVLYEASLYPGVASRISWISLSDLPLVKTSPVSTLYIPPMAERATDMAIAEKLGLIDSEGSAF